ncbi:MAG: hypothetical protein NTV34_08270 [Proteobacteria bacterium]|nr:hypothetical protein [Pseudomonadota bacterium]
MLRNSFPHALVSSSPQTTVDIDKIVVFVILMQILSAREFKNMRVNLSVLFIDVKLGGYTGAAENF